MAKRAKPIPRGGQSYGKAARNQNTATDERGKVQSPRILSSQASQAVGRPGFKGKVPGPVDGKASVTRVRQIDPARGITQPGADVITSSHVDLVGTQNPKIVNVAVTAPPNTGKRVVRTPRNSPPVYSSKPGRVVRSPGSR